MNKVKIVIKDNEIIVNSILVSCAIEHRADSIELILDSVDLIKVLQLDSKEITRIVREKKEKEKRQKRFVVYKGSHPRKQNTGYTNLLMPYLNYNMPTYITWKRLPVKIHDNYKDKDLVLDTDVDWRKKVHKWLNEN